MDNNNKKLDLRSLRIENFQYRNENRFLNIIIKGFLFTSNIIFILFFSILFLLLTTLFPLNLSDLGINAFFVAFYLLAIFISFFILYMKCSWRIIIKKSKWLLFRYHNGIIRLNYISLSNFSSNTRNKYL
ncbi:MAG: hypothetical protein HeimC3_53350 [Candidatus Heimdallarchaeota archaeon LC_3]|nr:MAG: hypothetical protein HeimC3_53350 [Candidatus Heimdallarchaeota archaeon LC_3]